MSGMFGFLGGLFEPLNNLISRFSNAEEKLKAQAALLEVQTKLSGKILDYETTLLNVKAEVMKAEAQSSHWFVAAWRPVAMLTFLSLIVADSLGFMPTPLNPRVWDIIELGMGGYVVGRTVEKVAPKALDSLKVIVGKK